jgi:tetratricopeptide (TPR) repeat protein
LSEEVKNALEMYRLDVSQALSDREFLAGLIREYTRTRDKPSGCALSDRELNELAGKVAGFDSGHALIARLIGEELARSNCGVGKVEELISNAKGKAEAFIILHINGLFKIHKNINTTKALVEIFALRRPFVDSARPGEPILTPGIIELIGEKKGASLLQSAEGGELRGWLAIRQHDLIEEAIGKLLDCVGDKGEGCEALCDALKPWKTIEVMESLRKTIKLMESLRETLMEVSNEVKDRDSAVKYFAIIYDEKLTNTLKLFSNCWKRAALIIGYASAGHDLVPRPEDLPSDVAESLGDALNRCEIDDYLLVGDEIPQLIPQLIQRLIRNYAYILAEAFVDKYNEAVAEMRRVLGIARDRGGFHLAEEFYGLGLASIIANAAESDKPIKPSDVDTALHIASFAIQSVASPDLIRPILDVLEPLRGKVPHRYIELLATASSIENLDRDTVRYIFDELNEILDNYGDVVKGRAWSLMYAIRAYANLLRGYLIYISDETDIEDVVGRVVDLLNELGRFKSSLGVIAWAYALAPALWHEDVRELMEKALSIDVVDKANEVLEKLSKLRGKVKGLMRNKEFMGYIESEYVKADEEAVKKEILEAASHLKYALAQYRLDNDELDKAEKLFKEAAEEDREIGDYENYLIDRGWALRVDAIKGSLVGDELVKKFRQLYEETFNEEHFEPTAMYLSIASGILGEYLVSLALINDVEEIRKLLEEHWQVLNANKQASVLTRLTLNALLSPRVRLSGELEGKLSVNPEELINAFESDVDSEFLPALMVAFGVKKPEDGIGLCLSNYVCEDSVLAVKGDSAAVERLRELLINDFLEVLIVRLNSFRELGVDVDTVFNEFRGLVYGLDGKSLAQLIAPTTSMARLALMLHALINGDERLAKAHALIGTVDLGGKLLTRLFLEAYRACCDLSKDEFRHVIAKLFFFHV